MKNRAALYENQWCEIIAVNTYYVLRSKKAKYNDQYFPTLEAAKRSIGILPDIEKYSFMK